MTSFRSLAPSISEIQSSSCVFHWQAHQPLGNDTIQYILQLQTYKKGNDYIEVYRGEATSYHATNLESGVDYRARVCVLRLTSEGLLLNSPYSSATHFILPRAEDIKRSTEVRPVRVEHRESLRSTVNRSLHSMYRKISFWKLFESRTLTDQQWAFVISVGFALLAMFIAIFANYIYSKVNHHSFDDGISSSSPGYPSS